MKLEHDPVMDETPDACSCSALRQATRVLTRIYDDALAPVGLGVNQYGILAKLDRGGPKGLQDLADLAVMDRSSLGHLLRPLERKGFVTIRTSQTDGRQRVIALTDDGVAVTRRARLLWAEAERGVRRSLGAGPAQDLRLRLRLVVTTLVA